MTTQKSLTKILVVITLLHSLQGAPIDEVEDVSTNAPTENTSGKPDDKDPPIENQDVPKDSQIIQIINQELNTDHIGNVDLQNETLTLQTGKKDSPKPLPAQLDEIIILDEKQNVTQKEFTESEILLKHEEFKQQPKESKNKNNAEFSYYTRPMGQDINTKQGNDPVIQYSNALESEHKVTATEHNKKQEEDDALQKLAEDKMHLIKENSDKENKINKLETEKKNLMKRIIESINIIVNNTYNNTEKKDLKELKSIIEVLGNIENTKENFPTTAKSASFGPGGYGIIAKLNIARKAAAGFEPGDFSPEDLNNFAGKMGADKNIERYLKEYTTRDYESEKERRDEHRKKVQKELDKWLQEREYDSTSTYPGGPTRKKYIEKCMNYGSTLDSEKKMEVRPCCIKCCAKSYLGCL